MLLDLEQILHTKTICTTYILYNKSIEVSYT